MPREIRQIRIKDNIAYVPLTQGYEAVIDADDMPLVDGFNWTALIAPKTVYAYRKDCSGPKQRAIYMHRVLMGEPEGMHIDHRDGDGLNNRKFNLRDATPSQNQQNSRLPSSNTSGFKGVSWHPRGGKWRAQIGVNGENLHLGLFPTPESAHAAYCSASADLHGKFGRIE
jgi:hypothetical protein